MYFKLRNDDNITNRVQIRKGLGSERIAIENFLGGKVCPGETKRVKVVLNTNECLGRIAEIVEVQTKSFLYKIPVKATVIRAEDYDKDKAKYAKEGRDLYSKNYPAGDSKLKCNPIKLVLPKIRELEEQERIKKLAEKKEKAEGEMEAALNAEETENADDKLPMV